VESEIRSDTGYVRRYPVVVNVTLSIDEQLVSRARNKTEALGKSLNNSFATICKRWPAATIGNAA
jgi:hypothetical protein